MQLKGKKAVFLGDSITEGVGTSCKEAIYLNVFAKKFELGEVKNYGVSGTRFARQPGVTEYVGFDEHFQLRAERMDDDADIVVVFGGTNDFGHGFAPIGGMSDRTVDTFYGACHSLMRFLIEKYPKSTIVFMTPLHRWGENNPCGEEKPHEYGTLADYRRIIMQVAEYYSLPVLDLYAVSGMQPEIPVIKEMYMPDALHPSDAGAAKIADLLGNFLLSL